MADVGDNLAVPLDDWRAGSTPSARHWNQPVEMLRGLTKGVAPPGQVVLPSGFAEAEEAGVAVNFFVVESSVFDYLLCENDQDPEAPIVVAKSTMLQPNRQRDRGGVGGVVYLYNDADGLRRTAIQTVDDIQIFQTEVVLPTYFPGDVVATVPTTTDLREVKDIEGIVKNAKHIELNGGRAWGAVSVVWNPVE